MAGNVREFEGQRVGAKVHTDAIPPSLTHAEANNGDPLVDLASGSWEENGSARVVVERGEMTLFCRILHTEWLDHVVTCLTVANF